MKGVILAAGLGTRLRPLTKDKPKPMMPIDGKPLLEHIIKLFRKHGIEEIFITTYYLSEQIIGYFSSGEDFGVEITYFDEPELLGIGRALKSNRDFFHETFLVMNGDEFTNLNLKNFFEFHKTKENAKASICVREPKGPEDLKKSGVMVLEEGRIREFREKPNEKEIKELKAMEGRLYASTGIYQFEPDVLNYIPDEKDAGITQVFPKLVEKGEFYGYPLGDSLWFEIGTPERYEKAKDTGVEF